MLAAIFILIAIFQTGHVSGQEIDPRCPLWNEGLVVHLPHEYDCNLFYKCNWGIPVLFECEYGLHFSPESDRCEYPYTANCQLQGSSTLRPTVTTTTLRTTTTQPSTLPPVGSRCPADNDPFDNPIYFAHEYDCSLFYMCFFGDTILYECSIGLHWSVHLNRCEVAELANCRLGQTTTTLHTTTTSTSTTTTPTSTTTSTSTTTTPTSTTTKTTTTTPRTTTTTRIIQTPATAPPLLPAAPKIH